MTDKDPPEAIRDIIGQVMDIEEVTYGGALAAVEATGKLNRPSEEAFALLETELSALDHTPVMYREEGVDNVLAVESEVMAPTRPLRILSVVLFLGTLVRLAQLGILQDASGPIASFGDYFRNWSAALPYAGTLLGVLVARELARFLVARRHQQKISWPLTLPLPVVANLILPVLFAVLSLLGGLGQAIAQVVVSLVFLFQMGWGTMGSFAVLRTPVRDRRVSFDMSVAATLAGLLVAVVVLVVGLLGSQVLTRAEINEMFPPGTVILQEGNSLLYAGLKFAVFGKWLPSPSGEDVLISTLANAGWAGLLVTLFHLLPFGQLDGGHVAHALLGRRARWLGWIVVVALLVLTVFYPGWLLWIAFMLLLMRGQAQVLDDITPLGSGRRIVGIVMLLLLVILFVPVPSRTVAITGILPGAPEA